MRQARTIAILLGLILPLQACAAVQLLPALGECVVNAAACN